MIQRHGYTYGYLILVTTLEILFTNFLKISFTLSDQKVINIYDSLKMI